MRFSSFRYGLSQTREGLRDILGYLKIEPECARINWQGLAGSLLFGFLLCVRQKGISVGRPFIRLNTFFNPLTQGQYGEVDSGITLLV